MAVDDQLVPTGSPLAAGHPWPGAGADRTALSLIAFLEANGAGEVRHAAGRSLLDHLVECSGASGHDRGQTPRHSFPGKCPTWGEKAPGAFRHRHPRPARISRAP